MSQNYTPNELIHKEDEHRFELHHDEKSFAFIDYKRKDNKIYLIHTEVPKEHRNEGLGEAIVQKTLEYIREKNLKLIPVCPFVKAYVERHADQYQDIL